MTSRRAATSVASVASTSAASARPSSRSPAANASSAASISSPRRWDRSSPSSGRGRRTPRRHRRAGPARSAATSSGGRSPSSRGSSVSLWTRKMLSLTSISSQRVGLRLVGEDLFEGVASVPGCGPVGDDQVGLGRDHVGVAAQVVAPALVAEQLGDVVVLEHPAHRRQAAGVGADVVADDLGGDLPRRRPLDQRLDVGDPDRPVDDRRRAALHHRTGPRRLRREPLLAGRLDALQRLVDGSLVSTTRTPRRPARTDRRPRWRTPRTRARRHPSATSPTTSARDRRVVAAAGDDKRHGRDQRRTTDRSLHSASMKVISRRRSSTAASRKAAAASAPSPPCHRIASSIVAARPSWSRKRDPAMSSTSPMPHSGGVRHSSPSPRNRAGRRRARAHVVEQQVGVRMDLLVGQRLDVAVAGGVRRRVAGRAPERLEQSGAFAHLRRLDIAHRRNRQRAAVERDVGQLVVGELGVSAVDRRGAVLLVVRAVLRRDATTT